jgi:hypothetical protein
MGQIGASNGLGPRLQIFDHQGYFRRGIPGDAAPAGLVCAQFLLPP